MFLLSWNVAGWSSTAHAIRESFGGIEEFFACTKADIICLQECKGALAKLTASPVEMGASDPPRSRRKKVAALARLEGRTRDEGSTPCSVAPKFFGGSNDGIEGWESFWSLSGKQHRGFNGVVTFVRKGLTWRCDSQTFGDAELDEEGRVVVTHHSHFVLINVYVPNARGGTRQNFKFRFLHSLQRRMEELRQETGKPVILVGDLNMTYRPLDASWTLRRLHLESLIALVQQSKQLNDASWATQQPNLSKAALSRVVCAITNFLCHLAMKATPAEASTSEPNARSPSSQKAGTEVVSVDTVNVDGDDLDRSRLLELQNRLRDRIPALSLGREATLNFDEPPASLQDLYNVGFRYAYVSDYVKGFPCQQNNEMYAVTRHCGLPPHSDAGVTFMSHLLHLDQPSSVFQATTRGTDQSSSQIEKWEDLCCPTTRMFDSFLVTSGIVEAVRVEGPRGTTVQELVSKEVNHPQLDPYCPTPFTCWDQSRNRRLENVGTRLDYILVDAALLPFIVCRAATPNNTGYHMESSNVSSPPTSSPSNSQDEQGVQHFFSEVQGTLQSDGARRAMAHGVYPAAPFDGSGMPPLSDSARELCFNGLPSTGLFVTPPQFSDHIGVGLLLDFSSMGAEKSTLQPRPGKVVEDHKCMYRPPVGLHSFFAAAASNHRQTPASPSSSSQHATLKSERSATMGDTDFAHKGADSTGKKTLYTGATSSVGMGGNDTARESCTSPVRKKTRSTTASTDHVLGVIDVDED